MTILILLFLAVIIFVIDFYMIFTWFAEYQETDIPLDYWKYDIYRNIGKEL